MIRPLETHTYCRAYLVEKRAGPLWLYSIPWIKNESLPPWETKESKGRLSMSYLPLTGKSLERKEKDKLHKTSCPPWRWLIKQTYGCFKSGLCSPRKQYQQSLIWNVKHFSISTAVSKNLVCVCVAPILFLIEAQFKTS